MRAPRIRWWVGASLLLACAGGCDVGSTSPRLGTGGSPAGASASTSTGTAGAPSAGTGGSPDAGYPSWACTSPYPTPTTRDPGLWPFASDSPWNTPLGDGAAFEQATDPCTRDLATLPPGGVAGINAHEWSHPVYLAAASDPTVNLYRDGQLADAAVRCPTDAAPALPPPPDTDAHLHIVDPAHRFLEEMWEASKVSDGWNAQAWAKTDLLGPGMGQGGVRAYGGSAIGGLVRVSELKGGIRHPLAFAIQQSQQRDGWVWPATINDNAPAANYTGHIPMGQLIGIPPGVDICSLGLSPAGLVVARALQDYGGYLVDTGGALVFYAEPRVEDDPSDGEATLLDAARNDLGKIVPELRCVTNDGSGSVGGGGARRAPPAPSVP